MKIIKAVLTVFLVTFFYFWLIESDRYISESNLKIRDDEGIDLSLNLVPSLGTNANKEIYEVEAYIFSDEAMDKLIDTVNSEGIEGFLEPNFFDLNKNFENDYRDYVRKFLQINLNEQTGILSLVTTSYNSQHSLAMNQIILTLIQFYFDKKQYIESMIISTNSLCNLVSNSIPEYQPEANKYFSFEDNKIEVLSNFYTNKRNECIEKINDDSDDKNNIDIFPMQLSESIINKNNEKLFSEFLETDKSKFYTSNKVILISNPTPAEYPEKKRPFLKSMLVSLLFVILYLSSNILLTIYRNFSE